MILNSLKTFGRNLVYLFIAMGIIYLFLIIAAYIFLAATLQNLALSVNEISELIASSAEDSSVSVQDFLTYSFGKIDWQGNFFETLRQIFSTDWLTDTITGFFETLNASTEGFGDSLEEIILEFQSKTLTVLAVAAVIFFIGINLANFATKYAIRRRNVKRNFKKTVIAHTVVPILQSLILGGFLILLPFIQGYSFLVAFALLIIMIFIALIGSWIVHRDGKLKLRQVLTLKNVLLYLCVILIIILINIVADVALLFISPLLAILFMMPLAIYSFGVADVNTDIFVCSLLGQEE